MFKRFLNGLVFGTGVSLAFLIISYLGIVSFVLPNNFSPQEFGFTSSTNIISEYDVDENKNRPVKQKKLKLPFHELGLDDQIRHSSVIALVEYKPSNDGKVRAVITEILKKEEGTVFYYSIGDEYNSASYYPKENRRYGSGVVIFFTGSPASMKISMSYSGDRIGSLGDLPIKLLREKCNQDNV